jgi:hypothetical protein
MMTENEPEAFWGSRPVPDPTKLTTDAVRELENKLTGLFDSKLKVVEGMLHAEVELTLERFNSIQRSLAKVEEQRLEQKVDTEKAVNVAFISQTNAIAQLKETFDRSIAAQRASFNWIVSLLGIGIAVILAIVTLIAFLNGYSI